MSNFNKPLIHAAVHAISRTALMLGVAFVPITKAHSQGIPVIDASAILQAIEQVRAWEAQYQQMVESLRQQQQIISAATGSRQLGQIVNAIVTPVLPPDLAQQLAQTNDLGQLTQIAVQNMGRLNTAMETRASQIQQLMAAINATNDPKSIQELTARIQAEQVMATNEAKEAQWFAEVVQLRQRAIDLAHRHRMLYGN